MQYFSPESAREFVGDCMPFFHEGRFHVFWLLDINHHRERGGLGAHAWAHSSSEDLVHWTHHPMAVPIGEPGAYDGASICTGSVIFHDSLYYAFFANRMLPKELDPSLSMWDVVEESLSVATSTDGVHFTKHPENPILYAQAPYLPRNFRDPFVFRDPDTGLFHMLVSTTRQDPVTPNRAGCLAHLTSKDLWRWTFQPEPFWDGEPGTTDPSRPGGGICPECVDYFRWGDLYYLIFSNYGLTHYRVSEGPYGPWRRLATSTFDSHVAAVMKTGAFHNGRRIGVAYVPTRGDDKDGGPLLYGGTMLFRELVQGEDGSLGTKWPAEMRPEKVGALELPWLYRSEAAAAQDREVKLLKGRADARLGDVPVDAYIRLRVVPGLNGGEYGLRLRADAQGRGYDLRFSPRDETVELLHPDKLPVRYRLSTVPGLEAPFDLEVVLYGDIIDVNIDTRRTLCALLTELKGDTLAFFTTGNAVVFSDICVQPYVPANYPPPTLEPG